MGFFPMLQRGLLYYTPTDDSSSLYFFYVNKYREFIRKYKREMQQMFNTQFTTLICPGNMKWFAISTFVLAALAASQNVSSILPRGLCEKMSLALQFQY